MKKRINAVVPEDLYIRVMGSYGITEAVVKGLELLINQDDIKAEYESKVKELEEQIRIISEIKLTDQKERTNDDQIVSILKAQIVELKEEIKEIKLDQKDQVNLLVDQMRIKDSQIEKLNDTLQNQVLNIHSLVQENTKLLPENTESKKPWWRRFW